jgi:hypothetical protein
VRVTVAVTAVSPTVLVRAMVSMPVNALPVAMKASGKGLVSRVTHAAPIRAASAA